jgi:hypothetical protein
MQPFKAIRQEMETQRLRMRRWRSSDSEAVRALWAERDPRSLHVIDSEGRPTVDELRAGLEADLVESTRTGLALLAVERRGEGDFIGY